MKLLLDNNLSLKIGAQLVDLYPDSSHVATLGLDTSSDAEVWAGARQAGYCLVSKDSDFNELLVARGFPPKVIWIRLGNCTSPAITVLLRNQYETIIDFANDPAVGLLALQ